MATRSPLKFEDLDAIHKAGVAAREEAEKQARVEAALKAEQELARDMTIAMPCLKEIDAKLKAEAARGETTLIVPWDGIARDCRGIPRTVLEAYYRSFVVRTIIGNDNRRRARISWK